jgi:hypothetical protein
LDRTTTTKVVALCFLLVLFFFSESASALSLPNPPDRSAPDNNMNGPIKSPTKQSFPPNILLVTDSVVKDNRPMNQFVANFYCTGGTKTITKQYKTEMGESISGPLTNDQTQGIIAAINSVRPKKTVNITVAVSGDPNKNTTYTLTGVTYVTTTYSIWVITNPGPPAQEQRVGYIVTAVPQQPPTVSVAATPCPVNHSTPTIQYGEGFTSDPNAWLYQPIIQILAPPDDGEWPFFQYGVVKVYSGGGIYAVSHIRPGENATFLLPPGSYSVSADVVLLGIPFSISGGSFTSPPGAIAILLNVSLTTEEQIWYGLEGAAAIILLAVVWLIVRHFRGTSGGVIEPKVPATPQTPMSPEQKPPKTEEPEDYGEDQQS